jgi:hypothetical protein
MAGILAPIERWTVFQDGKPAAGAKLFSYLSGTDTPSPLYNNIDLAPVHAHTNPVIADSTGTFPVLYLDELNYRFLVTDALGVTIFPAQDDINGNGLGSFVTTNGTGAFQEAAYFTDANTIAGTPKVLLDDSNAGFALSGVYPYVHLRATSDPVNQQDFRIVNNGGYLSFLALDSISELPPPITSRVDISRTGTLLLAAGQIQFPVVANPTANPTVLDDYREGLWTPEFIGSGGQSGITYGAQEGTFIKIGRLVQCWGRIQVSAMGTITGNVAISTLPYLAQNAFTSGGFTMYICNLGPPAFSSLGGIIRQATAIVDLAYIPAGGAPNLFTPLPDTAIIVGTDLFFGVVYIAAS